MTSKKNIILHIFVSAFLILKFQAAERKLDEQKEMWLTCRIDFQVGNNYFINFASYSNGDMVLMSSSIPHTNDREFYGLKKDGRNYFDSTYKIITMNDEIQQSTLSTIQVTNSEKEYLLIISKQKQTELYDFENSYIMQ